MQKIVDFKKCSGCHACYNACPKQCISMKPDSEGFLQPVIDDSLCINCGLCKKVCPVLSEYKGNPKGRAYACINNNEDIRQHSSSGGVFTLIAEYILNLGGVVFGAAFDEDLNVHHIEVTETDTLSKLRGSKYLQSRIGDTYKSAKAYLQDGKPVLFTGTPCQISGLYSYLGKDYENLYTQDLICHGVPSPDVWQKYLDYVKSVNCDTISKNTLPSFRDKSNGWKNYCLSIFLKNYGKLTVPPHKNLYSKAFLGNLSLRQSCYDCHSKSVERQSDITLADFWGIEKTCPEFFDDKGTSLVLVNSPKGKKLFDAVSTLMLYKEVNTDEALKYNPSAFCSVVAPKNRELFMRLANETSFDKAIKACIKTNSIKKVLRLAKRILRKVIK